MDYTVKIEATAALATAMEKHSRENRLPRQATSGVAYLPTLAAALAFAGEWLNEGWKVTIFKKPTRVGA